MKIKNHLLAGFNLRQGNLEKKEIKILVIISKGQATGMCAIKMGNYTFLKTARGGPKII